MSDTFVVRLMIVSGAVMILATLGMLAGYAAIDRQIAAAPAPGTGAAVQRMETLGKGFALTLMACGIAMYVVLAAVAFRYRRDLRQRRLRAQAVQHWQQVLPDAVREKLARETDRQA
jgi:hypothetical protein